MKESLIPTIAFIGVVLCLQHQTLVDARFLRVFRRSGRPTTWKWPSFERYYSYEEIRNYLRIFADSQQHVKVEKIGKSFEDKPLYVLKVEYENTKKDTIFFSGGAHAREWIAPAAVLYLAYQFVRNPDNDPEIVDLLKTYNWYFLVSLNPDGYEYSRKADRQWRKSRRINLPYSCEGPRWPPKKKTHGVDLNRNFDVHFYHSIYLIDQSSDQYPGPVPFSEPETRSFRDFVMKYNTSIKAHFAVHSYGKSWIYSPMWRKCLPKCKYTCDLRDVDRLAKAAIQKMPSYRAGPADCIYSYTGTGTVTDWMSEIVGVKYAYTIELGLRPGKPDPGFQLPEKEIPATGKELLEQIKAFAVELQKPSKCA